MSALTLLLQSSHGDPMVALGRDGDVLFDSSADPQFDQSRDLRVMLEAGLAAVGAHVSDISKIGCDIGPGGLGVTRTAASFANALSYARDLPLYPIRAFDLLGAEFGGKAPLVILRRAGRPFVHFGLFEKGALTQYRHGKEDEERCDASGARLSHRGGPHMSAAREICDCLRAGGVVLIPTDTVLGLAVLPEHAAKIYRLKERPLEKNLPIMVANRAQLETLGMCLSAASKTLLASSFMPGALTLVDVLDPAKAPSWLEGREEMAVRIPNAPLLLSVLEEVGPLLVTSANRSGAQTPATSEEACAQLSGSVDLIIDGTGQQSAPSTIVNCASLPPKIEREGAVARADIRALIGELK